MEIFLNPVDFISLVFGICFALASFHYLYKDTD
jgi:hypothetical protein